MPITTANLVVGGSLWPSGWRVCLPNRRSVVQIQHPTSPETCMWGKQPAAMLAIYTSRGVAPEVNLREHMSCTPPQSLNKAEPTLALKPIGDVTRSLKQGYQWPQKWTCVQ